ncbi:hypothetical protein C8Q75DRAFT_803618 [Abortiporus biennis]|nr:hypothetical protein C8Q75DRAFT_803618 [Abortiporus biennis]
MIPFRHGRYALAFITTLTCFTTSGYAVPYPYLQSRQDGSSSGDSTNTATKIWVPILAVAVVVIGLVAFACAKRGWRVRLPNWNVSAALGSRRTTSNGTNAGARELTAEQLAGTTANDPAIPAVNPRARRTARRTRRTPSQISTRSLPVYMKEPGDQELVIYRGPDDLEDMPTVIDMPTVREHGSETPDTLDMSRASTREYDPMPDSPHDQPLLHPDDSLATANTADTSMGDNSTQNLLPPRNLSTLNARPSFESLLSAEGNSSPNIPPALDPRGEAPSYFEAVSMDELNHVTSRMTDISVATPSLEDSSPESPVSSAEPPATESSGARRRSGFFSFFSSRPNSVHRPAVPPIPAEPVPRPSTTLHARTESGPSVRSISPSVDTNHVAARAMSRQSHRPSHSGSGSVFSIGSSAFRTLSRTKSNSNLIHEANNLTSPSTLSINSISAPLTHTLVRTEFTYPKSGPTPEQLKLISSRESFAKFGVPYGPDAIAYHASHSRLDVSHPPPTFEEAESSSPGAGPSSASTQPEASSTAEPETSESRTSHAAVASESSGTSSSPEDVHEEPDIVDEHHQLLPVEESLSEESQQTQPDPEPEDDGRETSTESSPQHRNLSASTSDETKPLLQEVPVKLESDSPLVSEKPNESVSEKAPETVVESEKIPDVLVVADPLQTDKQSNLANLALLSSKPSSVSLREPQSSPRPSQTSHAPPSAFKSPSTTNLPRSESRASSFVSFATAEESLPSTPVIPQLIIPDGDSTNTDDEGDETFTASPSPGTSAPPTPRMIPRHLNEPTDTTVTMTITPATPVSPVQSPIAATQS